MGQKAFTEEQVVIIKHILKNYPYPFFAFGSRVKGTHKKYSDLDVCYKIDIPDIVIAQLAEDFEQSNLPFKVDIVDWKRCLPGFQVAIAKDLVPLETLL